MKLTILAIYLAVQCVSVLSLELSDISEDTLYFGQRSSFNSTAKDCVTRDLPRDADLCSKDVSLQLFSNGIAEVVDPSDPNWLHRSRAFDPRKPTIFTVHGYAGGDNSNSYVVLRQAFEQNGQYNVFVFDYGPVSRPPCYVQMVHNVDYVSFCVSNYVNQLIAAGLPCEGLTCVGHSIGAHICGHMTKRLPFRLHKIVALDPAAPLIGEDIHLSRKDAVRVHTLQTNAGVLGELGTLGHVDVCVNQGITQPFCADATSVEACSHFYSLCFTAQSLFYDLQQEANTCKEICPNAKVFESAKKPVPTVNPNDGQPQTILWGVNIPDYVEGSYCLVAPNPPFCPKYLNGFGNERCCSYAKMFE